MDKIILVLYVDVADLDDKDVGEYVTRVGKALFPEDVKQKLDGGLTFVIPRRGGGTCIEVINPKFVIDQNVYNEFRTKLEILNTNLSHLIELKS